ncbi:MAG: transposase [Spirosomataceae bacterium]
MHWKKKYDALKLHPDQISEIPMSILNPIGAIAYEMWLAIPTYFPFIELGCFVIMPNHVHGILIINNENVGTRDDKNVVEARLIAPLPNNGIKQKNGGFAGDKNPMFHSNISRVIRWYKGRCSFEIRKLNEDFGWQSSFYDHIIRTPKAFENIQNYIENNPSKWADDYFSEID